jgi:phosphopantetheinyl transferase
MEMIINIIEDGEAIILIGTSDEDNNVLKNRLLNVEIYQDEINQTRNPKRLREFLMVRLLLQQFFDCNPVVQYNEVGKPGLPESGYELSISHCSRHAAVILHPHRKVGTDIENRGRNVQKVARRFLGSEEQTDFAGKENTDALLLIWSAKEALFKIIGNEAYDFGSSLRIYPFEPAASGVMKAEFKKTGKLYSLQYRCSDSYVLVWAIE